MRLHAQFDRGIESTLTAKLVENLNEADLGLAVRSFARVSLHDLASDELAVGAVKAGLQILFGRENRFGGHRFQGSKFVTGGIPPN